MTHQPALPLNLPPAPNPAGLFWCCTCHPLIPGRTSLLWQPPDYRRGMCIYCKRVYEFDSRWGKVELAVEVQGMTKNEKEQA